MEKKVKEVAVVSGKGGTGKTVITAALATLIEDKIVCDCDVDAANLHLILKPEVERTTEFYGGELARIDPDRCSRCMECVEVCRSKAIVGNPPEVVGEFCEGCAACYYACPADAVEMVENKSGDLFVSKTRTGPMVHAKLGIAEDNSGKLVSEVRKEALTIAEREGLHTIIIDGPPGIGCPVIASITGVDLLVLVTEPTVSGIHDLKRVLELAARFNLPSFVIVNKFDINREITGAIEDESRKLNARVVGEIPFSLKVMDSIREAKTLVEAGPPEIREEIVKIWETVRKKLSNHG